MKANKALKYRIYPSNEQSEHLNLCFAANRKTWNYMLDRFWAIDEEEKEWEENKLSVAKLFEIRQVYILFPGVLIVPGWSLKKVIFKGGINP